MPWSPKDVSKHKAGLSSAGKEKWSRVANAILAKPGYDEANAIRIANSVTKGAVKRRLKRNIQGAKYKKEE